MNSKPWRKRWLRMYPSFSKAMPKTRWRTLQSMHQILTLGFALINQPCRLIEYEVKSVIYKQDRVGIPGIFFNVIVVLVRCFVSYRRVPSCLYSAQQSDAQLDVYQCQDCGRCQKFTRGRIGFLIHAQRSA